MLFYLNSFLIIAGLINIASACSGLQNTRTCSCSTSYSFRNENPTNTLLLPFKSYDDCGINLGCEKVNDCALYCLRQAKQILGSDPINVNQAARDSLCSLIAPNQSITGMYSGISVWSNWQYSNCKSDTSQLISNICCKKRCACELVGQTMTSKNVELLITFTKSLTAKPLAYSCAQSEFDTCEQECRMLVGNKFKNDELKVASNKLIPNYNVFQFSFSGNQRPQVDTYASELLCQELNRKVETPGYDIFVKISTDQANFNNMGKYLPLGRLCCKQECKCEIYTQNAEVVSGTDKDKSDFFEDITYIVDENIRTRAYDCFNTKQSCMSFCRDALGQYLQSDLILSNSTVYNWLTTDLDVFSEETPGTRVCAKLHTRISTPGLNFFLRSNTGSREFPFTDDMYIGRLCCFPFPIVNPTRYVPFNRCYNFP